MAKAQSQDQTSRIAIEYFEGLNSYVSSHISKRQELSHVENARSRTVGSIEKRGGTRRLADAITATANYKIFYFENDGSSNNGFYRISNVNEIVTIYYVNGSSTWTALTGNGTALTAGNCSTTIAEGCCFIVNGLDDNRYIDSNGTLVNTSADLGGSTSQFDITNPSGTTFRYTYDGTGTDPSITSNVKVGTVLFIRAQNFTTANNGAFTVTAVGTDYFEVTNAAGVAESNKTIGTGFLRVSGHLYGSPKTYKINFYKNRLYLGDFTNSAGTRFKSSVFMSSTPLGIVGLVSGDHATAQTTINVTDTKYIHATDYLDVYRGNTLITTLIVTAKTEDTITVSTTSVALNSADELWVAKTFGGNKVFRWPGTIAGGIDVKQYDTIKITGGRNDSLTMMENLNDVMVIANQNNIAVWNDANLLSFETSVGIVSERGYVKMAGTLFFLDYTGIYMMDGSQNRPQLISTKVEPYITGATKAGLEAAAMGRKGESVFCAFGDSTLYNVDGSVNKTLPDACVEMNLRQKNWFLHTGIKATEFTTYVSSGDADRLEYASTESGYHIFEFLTGEVDDKVTNDYAIPFRIDTNALTLSTKFEQVCYPQEIAIETERGSGLKVFISMDNEPWYELEGQVVKGAVILKVTARDLEREKPPRCRTIKLSIRDYTKKLCKISRIALIYSISQEQEDQRN